LTELPKKPHGDMTMRDLASLILGRDRGIAPEDELLMPLLQSGTCLNHIQIREACMVVKNALVTPRLADALLHLEYSYSLVWGFMVGSYYEAHYSRDRRSIPRYELEKRYLENRLRYDTAFVSAFRGIEALLGKPQLKKGKVASLFAALDEEFGTHLKSTPYRSWHEVFSSRKRWWESHELVEHYLRLRNAVSAHGNTSPPNVVMEDQVLEIQYFLRHLLLTILLPDSEDS
jgi:hypothetical protein